MKPKVKPFGSAGFRSFLRHRLPPCQGPAACVICLKNAVSGRRATLEKNFRNKFETLNKVPLTTIQKLGLALKQLFAALILFFSITLPALADTCPPLLQHNFPVLQDGKSQSLCQWQGKVLLIVNTASFCGFTSQYDGLEKLYARLKNRGLVVVGFPSNEFGDQEPGGNQEIADFCRLTYGVQFPMFAKASVVGKQASPFYRQLATASGTEPQWNFHKYLIDRSGRQVLSFGSRVRPDDPELLARIDAFLGK